LLVAQTDSGRVFVALCRVGILRRVSGRGRPVAAIAVAALALVLARAAVASGPLPTVLTQDSTAAFAVKPTQIVVSANGTVVIGGPTAWNGRKPAPNHPASQFGRITWRSWSATQATGVATEWGESGRPNVAEGTYLAANFNIVASRVRDGHFTRLTLTQRNGKPGRETLALRRAGAGYTWG
jgi:hypothetical protein